MPKDITAPIILVGPGTGVAPFRGFWHHRRELLKEDQANPGAMWLIFGCRNQGLNLYEEEKAEALKNGVLTKSMVALSREDGVEKVDFSLNYFQFFLQILQEMFLILYQ